jgi:glycosyltransferase involved in cell wall biosynthesis
LNNPKVSIITICFNAEKTISDTIQSVLYQTYSNIEYIIIDGASKDSTLEKVQSFKNEKMLIVSEPDKGLYDALNKGLRNATGDIIGILHADDKYASKKVIEDIAEMFQSKRCDAVSSSVNIFKDNNFDKPYRKYNATNFKTWQFTMGIQPPHPGFFISKEALIKVGEFDISYKISGDFDWLLRAIRKHKINVFYTTYVSVFMRDGGISSSGWKSKVLMNKEDLNSLKKNGFKSHILLIWMKYFIKLFQLI